VTTVEGVLTHYTSNDRQFFERRVIAKSTGDTDQVHQLTERAWAAKGRAEHDLTKTTVIVNGNEVVYKDVVLPVPDNSRVGLAHIVNATSCVAFIEAGQIKPTPTSKDFAGVYSATPIAPSQVSAYVDQLSQTWEKARHVEYDRQMHKTYRGLECSSVFTRFFAGLPVAEYVALHSFVVLKTLGLYEFEGTKPTERPVLISTKEGEVPLFEKGSISQLTPANKGDWGAVAEKMKHEFKVLPKILTGPIDLPVKWLDPKKDSSVKAARAAVMGSLNLRGGEKSYWSKIMNCVGFSVATDYVNRMRLLVAMATGVLEMSNTKVQIAVQTCELDVVNHSLDKYAEDRVYFLVPPEVKVKLSRHALNTRVHCVPVDDTILIAINDIPLPSPAKGGDPEPLFEETMTSFFSTIGHSDMCIWAPVLGQKDLLKWGVDIVSIRPPYDMYAVLTTNPKFVSSVLFPSKKVHLSYRDFCVDVITATSGTFRQIFQPVQVRSKSKELLNILRFPSKAAVVVLNRVDGSFECAAMDDGVFDYDEGSPGSANVQGGGDDDPRLKNNRKGGEATGVDFTPDNIDDSNCT